METTEHTRPMVLLPATKGQRMLRLKDAWEKLSQAERTSAVDLDVQRATLLAEELAEPTSDEPIKAKDLAEVTGIRSAYIGQLLRYHRFRSFCISLNFAIAKIEITEGRFRDYWKELSDPQTMKSLTRNEKEKHAYEQRVFLVISQYLEAGKPPPKTKAVQPETVDEMHTKKDPVRALRKEVKRLYTTECKPIIQSLKGFLGQDRATFSPNLMANAAMKLEQWEKRFETLLDEFEKYSKE